MGKFVFGLVLASGLFLTGCAQGQNSIGQNSIGQNQEQYFKAGIPELTPIEEVTDEFGRYTRTTVADVESVQFAIGGTLDEVTGIQVGQWLLKFIAEEALDSIVLDNQNAWEKWTKEVGPEFIHSDYINDILSVASFDDFDGTTSAQGTAVIMTDAGNALPTLIRDGGVRVGKKMFSEFIVRQEAYQESEINVYVRGQADYYVSDESAKAWFDSFYDNDEYSNSQETLKDGNPQYLPIDFSLSYTLKEEGTQWKIAGHFNSFSVLAAYMTRPDSSEKVNR